MTPRNTQNTPAGLEKNVLAELASTNLSEKIIQGPGPTIQSLKQAGDASHV
jgi:hypothetical protein